MSQISAIGAATTASQAVQASSANADAGNTTQAQSDLAQLGLPPANLAKAASVNTLNAELVSSQFGIDPASVSGVYGGAAASSGSLFADDNLLPLLQSLSSATAAQALALIGVQTPTPGEAPRTPRQRPAQPRRAHPRLPRRPISTRPPAAATARRRWSIPSGAYRLDSSGLPIPPVGRACWPADRSVSQTCAHLIE
jgi:hypothetical protein